MATTRSANVLVCFGEHKRPVTFTCLSDPKADRKRLEEAVINKFHDVMVETRSSRSGLSLLLQIKSEGWGGEFIDLPEDAELPDGSVLRAIILEPQVTSYKNCTVTVHRLSLACRAKIFQGKDLQFARS